MLFVASFLICMAGPQVTVGPGCATITGLKPEQLQAWASRQQSIGIVCVVQSKRADETPMLGEWGVGTVLTFSPRFPFELGTPYRIVIPGTFEATFTLPAADTTPGRVEAVFPAAEKLPANLLRFYLHFDREMKPGQGYRHFQLIDDKNAVVPFAFLELDEELWSTDGKRLTLLLDPGRVKKELVPHKELGPVLTAGRSYTLRIAKEYQTRSGQPLTEEYRKKFTVTDAVENGLDPAKWTLTSPKSGTKAALELKFGTLMDHALLNRVITVEAGGKSLPGAVVAGTDDTKWQWAPQADWQPGRYTIVIEDLLEDVCGNRIAAAFDSVLGEVGRRRLKAPTRLPFEVK